MDLAIPSPVKGTVASPVGVPVAVAEATGAGEVELKPVG